MSSPWPTRGLYAITDSRLTPPATLQAQVAAAIAGGAVIIQYRDKLATRGQRHARAAALLELCRQQGVPLIINDDTGLAARLGAGVHLGRDDDGVASARRQLGPDALIGASCYNDLQRAHAAASAGADYVAFGRFFSSRSKPQAVAADIALLQSARRSLALPIVAIGGITPDNGATLVAAGADLVAAIDGVFGATDVQLAAHAYRRLFRQPASA